ncbi:hypothetical protein ACQKNB_14010 [Lysinibacillus xylanilyticus]|uniref:hypothetical protein n=1 Tax=Lysinibacillus xylanilyticus TaxID=582475 RepID=UPI003D055C94
MGISDRGTKAKTITSCDNAFVTNIVLLPLLLRARNICWPETLQSSGCFLCESVATATTKAAHRTPPGNFALCESVVLT